jgi:hypothetical protein
MYDWTDEIQTHKQLVAECSKDNLTDLSVYRALREQTGVKPD